MNLTAKRIARLRKTPGRYRDDDVRGLYLQVVNLNNVSWVLRYERGGRERMLGLGALNDFSLKEARERARRARQLLADGIDPLEQKQADKVAKALASARTLTFQQAAEQYFAQHERKWRNPKHRAQFLSTLHDYAFPIIGKLPVADLVVGDILKVLEYDKHEKYHGRSLWSAIPETANRVRGRIEQVLDWATVRGYRTGDNPARWRGHLDNALPARAKLQKPEHHPALAYTELPGFLAELKMREGVAASALEFTILCAARTGETIGAVWDEINLTDKVWTVPAGRIKGGKEHRVPLSDRAVELLKGLPREAGNRFVFIGGQAGSGLSNMAMATLLRRMGRDNITVHGFRSTFMDWAHERTAYPKPVIDMALAHVVGDKVEAAYRRGDLFDKRRRLMSDWAKYCSGPPVQESGEIVQLRGAR